MIAVKLAYRNLIGAGLRTWLNVIVLSLAYVVVIWSQGFLHGWDEQASHDTIEWEIGGGQYWQQYYDPFDPLSLENGHDLLPPQAVDEIEKGLLTPILVVAASMYPQGRIQSVVLKGIDPDQKILAIPSVTLKKDIVEIPAVIGSRMAKDNKLRIDDVLTIRWRDVHGTFDAQEVRIVDIMRTNVPSVDKGQIWLPLQRLRDMVQMPGQASILVADKEHKYLQNYAGWVLKDQQTLLQPIQDIIRAKSVGTVIMFVMLLLLALLAIFDTQVLAIFRRRKEIGTLMALGMTRGQVIRLFTVEGAMHAVLAVAVAAIYGIPLLYYTFKTGWKMPEMADDVGVSIAGTIFPHYSAQLVLGTIFIVLVAVTIISFLPTRKIAKLNPTEAIRGKLS